MTVFCHHIYEYKKGLRNLVLHTLPATARPGVERKLTTCGIDYLIHPLGEKRINVFFGAAECVDVVRRIDKPLLRDYTPEEDFILGIMLGYDRLRQCGRFLERAERGYGMKEDTGGVLGGSCKTSRGMGVPPMKHGQDARATAAGKGFCKNLLEIAG